MWYDTFQNQFNFFRWADAERRSLSEIQVPSLYCVGTKSTATTTGYVIEVYENKNNFFRWINMDGLQLSQLSNYFCDETGGSRAYSDGYSDGYS